MLSLLLFIPASSSICFNSNWRWRSCVRGIALVIQLKQCCTVLTVEIGLIEFREHYVFFAQFAGLTSIFYVENIILPCLVTSAKQRRHPCFGPQRSKRITGNAFCISARPNWPMGNGIFNRLIMVLTQLYGPRTRISVLYRRRT